MVLFMLSNNRLMANLINLLKQTKILRERIKGFIYFCFV